MLTPKVNLLSENGATRKRRRLMPSPLTIMAIFLLTFVFGRMTMSQTASVALNGVVSLPILDQMRHLIGSPDRSLQGETEDRINILIMGMGGEGHDGPLLTDTLMVASIRPSDNKVAILSIPRDLLVPLPNFGWKKINSANAYGELANPGHGAEQTRDVIEELLGVSVPYYVRVDFDGFRTLIDSVDGIDIYVDRDFSDYSYPTANHGMRTVSFKKGWKHMTGEDSLIFARSRHGTNGEGSDFARSKRQQKVLSALKDKASQFKTLKNPAVISNLLAALRANVVTNLQIGEIIRFARMAQNVDTSQIIHEVLDNGQNSPLADAVLNGAYVLVPKDDDWQNIRDIAARLLDTPATALTTLPQPPPPTEDGKPSVEIRNGTLINGLGARTAAKLGNAGFLITKISTAEFTGLKQTVVYDLTAGSETDALHDILQVVGAADVKDGRQYPGGDPPANLDFLIVLGQADN